MSVRIGHARIGSNGEITGDEAGDNNGKEVSISYWYDLGGTVIVLRPKTKELASKLVANCQKLCANNYIGYNQLKRNTAHKYAKAVNYDLTKIATKCDTDCSAAQTLIALASGVTELEYTLNAPTTKTMVDKFVATGKFTKLTDDKYTHSSDYAEPGDIYVRPGKHTFMALDYGAKAKTSSTSTTTTTTETFSQVKKYSGITTATVLNMRKSYTTDSTVLMTLRKGTAVDICDSKVVNNKTWYYVKYNGTFGWCSATYVTKYASNGQAAYIVSTKKSVDYNNVYTTTAKLNMRRYCGTSSALIKTFVKDQKVYCNGYYVESDGVKWLLVSADTYTGYMSSKYLTKA